MTPLHSSTYEYPLDTNRHFCRSVDQYMAAQISCLSDYHTHHEEAQASQNASRHLRKWAVEPNINSTRKGDPEALLNMAIRYLSGCSTTGQCPEGALYVLDALLDPECDPERYVGHLASTAVLAQAHSCAANAHFLKLMASPDQILDMVMDERRFRRTENALDEDPALAYFIFAVQHANQSAKLGLVSPVVLQIGFAARETGASLGVEPCQMKRSRHVRFLWGAVMANLEEIYDEERKRREAFHGRRGGCVCAAEGCGIRAEGGATLRACSGRCPRDLKPRYCSKTCQKKDWPGHKTVCKAASVRKAPVITDKAGALVFFQLGEDHQDAEDVEAAAHSR